MEIPSSPSKRKRPLKKILLWIFGSLFVILSIASFFLYNNFNRLLTTALMKNFNANVVSDVYELKFKRLSVNFVLGNIKVYDVEMYPREKPLQNYPYINTSFKLKTAEILLTNVEIFTLLKQNILKLERIKIAEPTLQFLITDKIPIIFPFKDSTRVTSDQAKSNKRSIESFFLKEFDLLDASLQVNNLAREREFSILHFNFSLRELMMKQLAGKDIMTYKNIEFSIGSATGLLRKEPIKRVSFSDFTINFDSLQIQKSVDTMIYHFADFRVGMDSLDIQTADSIFHITMQSFNLSYKNKSIKIQDISFRPNVSEARLDQPFKYQHTQFSGSVGTLNLVGVNFNSLIYNQQLFIDEVVIDKVSASIFKDKTRPMDLSRFPEYLGQSIKAIKMPLMIKLVKATNVNLVNREKNVDGSYAKANINRATVEVKNLTSLSTDKLLVLNADAYLEHKAHFDVSLGFNYSNPQFSFSGNFKAFNLPDLNPLIQSYTPASIKKGIADEITFSGTAYHSNSTGTMKFLYHDLDVDLQLKEQAKWKSSVLAFAANSVLPGANPHSAGMPPRVVEFHMDRDMNKSFVNILIKSLLNGLKETMIMSKENKKAFKQEKKESKKEAKEAKKIAKKEAKEAKKGVKNK